jgi:hypothetical protein
MDAMSADRVGPESPHFRQLGYQKEKIMIRAMAIRRLGAACAITAGIVGAGCGEAGLSESSTCKEFLAAAPADQQSVTQQLAGKFGKSDYATPLGMPAVPYYCANHPDVTLQEFFESAG